MNGNRVNREEIKVIAAFSGGLDSILAAVFMRSLGFNVTLLHVQHLFSASAEGRERLKHAAEHVGLPLIIEDASVDHLETIRHPKHGYGRGMNPCIDCRIFMLKIAKRVMESQGAEFVITGEVLGQRPKSQHHKALLQAADESGLGDRLVRPLCAQLLPDTLPVTKGWVKREELLSISGRSRQQQMALAEKLGVQDYPQPAGGCVLIEQTYADRVRDAFTHLGADAVDRNQFELFRFGRHFRISETVKAIVGRDHADNLKLAELAGARWRMDPIEVMGPTTLVEGEATAEELELIAGLAARYCKDSDITILMALVREGEERTLTAVPWPKDDPRIEEWRIG